VRTALAALERLEWQGDRVLLDDLVFRLGDVQHGEPDAAADCFDLKKPQPIVNEYHDLFAAHPGFQPQQIFELGIWDGGSTAFWFELFDPLKHVAVDLLPREDSDYFKRYVASRNAADRIATYWSTDQSDKERLREIVGESFDGPLDLVIDDASHLYGPTKASFEALFPLLASGGLYVVEDWPWGHLRMYREPEHPWADETSLTELVLELVRALGSAPGVIRRVHVYFAFVVVERGSAEISDPTAFSLDELVASMR